MRVDSTPPAIAFSGYGRAFYIWYEHDQAVSVDGTFVDGISEIVGGTFDGSALTVSGDSTSTSFTESFTSRWGTNVLSASAEDACGNVAVSAVLVRGEFAPVRTSENSGARVTSAWLGI